jgi:hypothetical protein
MWRCILRYEESFFDVYNKFALETAARHLTWRSPAP